MIQSPGEVWKPAARPPSWPSCGESEPREGEVGSLQSRQYLKAIVRAAVVDDNDFVRAPPGGHRTGELLRERLERRRLVAHGNHDTQIEHTNSVIWRLFIDWLSER